MYPLTKFTSNRSIEEAEKVFYARISDSKRIWEKYRSEFIYRSCPICDGQKHKAIEPFYDTFDVDLCLTCNTPFVNPAPNEEALFDYYKNGISVKMINQILKKRSENMYHHIVDDRIKLVLDLITYKKSCLINQFNILEVGCNQGAFLSRLRKALFEVFPDCNFNLTGIDIDAEALSLNSDPDISLIHGSIESLATEVHWLNNFDIIICFELIEHLVHPSLFMKNANNMLKPEGNMIITTPNYEGLEIKAAHYNHYRLLAHTIFPPFHLNSFSTLNFTHFALRNNYKIVRIETPGKLDVDIVSLYEQNSDTVPKVISDIDLLDEQTKGWLQALITNLKASSNMLVILNK